MSLFSADLCRRARARNLADQLLARDASDRIDLVSVMITENGATLVQPQPLSGRSAQRFEIDMLGVFASGTTMNEAIAEWIDAARRAAPQPNSEPSDFDAQVIA